MLATGDALVFSPAAVITAGVGLLGRDHLKLRVRPRVTLDGSASLLAVGRSLPAPALAGSAASPVSPPTSPVSESSLPTQRETRISTAQWVFTPNLPSATPFTPLGAPATPAADRPAPGPSALTPSAVESVASAQRVPARLEYLVSWLLRRGGADAPVKLKEAKKTLFGVGNTGIYANMTKLEPDTATGSARRPHRTE
jgi:hypothetical protein